MGGFLAARVLEMAGNAYLLGGPPSSPVEKAAMLAVGARLWH